MWPWVVSHGYVCVWGGGGVGVGVEGSMLPHCLGVFCWLSPCLHVYGAPWMTCRTALLERLSCLSSLPLCQTRRKKRPDTLKGLKKYLEVRFCLRPLGCLVHCCCSCCCCCCCCGVIRLSETMRLRYPPAVGILFDSSLIVACIPPPPPYPSTHHALSHLLLPTFLASSPMFGSSAEEV